MAEKREKHFNPTFSIVYMLPEPNLYLIITHAAAYLRSSVSIYWKDAPMRKVGAIKCLEPLYGKVAIL